MSSNAVQCSWLQRCDECIEQLEELCRAKRLCFVGHKQSLVARIARLVDAKLQLKRGFVHISGEYASGKWKAPSSGDAAFETRPMRGQGAKRIFSAQSTSHRI